MRHAVEKVKEAILHADQDVRDAAIYYFAESHSSDPTVMPLVIQAIETYGFNNAFSAYSFLKEIVQTNETIRWLIQQLRELGQTADGDEAEPILAYVSALVHAAPTALKDHEFEIMALDAMDAECRDAVGEQVWFPTRSGEELWEDLEYFCQTHEGEDSIPDEEFDFALRVVEALGFRKDQFAETVLAIIGGKTDEIGTLKEGFAIRLAGEMKLEAAIPLIMTTLYEAPDDWINEECLRALTKIGSEAVVARFAIDYATSEWLERMSIACTLEDIHSDRAVQTCLDCLQIEKEPEIYGVLLESVLLNFSTEGIEPARRFILDTPLNPDVLDVRSTLLTACKLMGQTFPEFDVWLEDSKNDQEFRRKWYEEHPLPSENEILEDKDEEDEDYENAEPPPVTMVRRSEPIGRNDPCPCGSGKTFKRCCQRKNQVVAETDSNHASAVSDVLQGKSKAKFPIGTVAHYGPNHKMTTKIVAGVIEREGAEPILQRWMGTKIKDNVKVQKEMQDFFLKHAVKKVVATEGNIGCPHEEGEDFPLGGDCPFCPFWKGKQGSNRQE